MAEQYVLLTSEPLQALNSRGQTPQESDALNRAEHALVELEKAEREYNALGEASGWEGNDIDTLAEDAANDATFYALQRIAQKALTPGAGLDVWAEALASEMESLVENYRDSSSRLLGEASGSDMPMGDE